jgi:hypothetical protein
MPHMWDWDTNHRSIREEASVATVAPVGAVLLAIDLASFRRSAAPLGSSVKPVL